MNPCIGEPRTILSNTEWKVVPPVGASGEVGNSRTFVGPGEVAVPRSHFAGTRCVDDADGVLLRKPETKVRCQRLKFADGVRDEAVVVEAKRLGSKDAGVEVVPMRDPARGRLACAEINGVPGEEEKSEYPNTRKPENEKQKNK